MTAAAGEPLLGSAVSPFAFSGRSSSATSVALAVFGVLGGGASGRHGPGGGVRRPERRRRRRWPTGTARVDRLLGRPAAGEGRKCRGMQAGGPGNRPTARWGCRRPSGRCLPDTRDQRCWWHEVGNVLELPCQSPFSRVMVAEDRR
jgi:hypothetical protein